MDCAIAFKTVNGLVEKYHEDMLARLNSILNLIKENSAQSQASITSFLNGSCTSYYKKKKEIYTKHDIDNTLRFNFFESISDKWYMENFHSDILYTILNPATPEIGRKYFVEEFVKFLGIEDRFDCMKDFEVTREKGRIDLLIKNDTQAIIIENKINYARDMENQLVRYMKYVDEEFGIKTYTVVYLTLIDDNDKKPPLDSYDSDFKKYAGMLNDKNAGILKEVYAVDSHNGLAKHLLPRFCKRLQEEQEQNSHSKESCDIAWVYINQYKILLEHLGGKAYMKSADKKLIEDIYSSQDKFDAANDFVEFWNDKKRIKEALRVVMKEKFRKTFPDKELHWLKINGYEEYSWPSNFSDALIFWDGIYQIGFTSQEGDKFPKARQDELLGILNGIQHKESEEKYEQWVYCDIEDSPTLLDDILNGLKLLFDAK